MLELLPLLRSLAASSERMRAAAERRDWNALSIEAEEYFSRFTSMQTLNAPLVSAVAESERISLLQQLARNQELIRSEIDPWMESAGKLLAAWSRIPPDDEGSRD